MNSKHLLTPAQVKAEFRRRGQTIVAWAAEHGYDVESVYRVLNGKDKAYYGRAHKIAVELGLKERVNESSAASGERNTQSRQAA